MGAPTQQADQAGDLQILHDLDQARLRAHAASAPLAAGASAGVALLMAWAVGPAIHGPWLVAWGLALALALALRLLLWRVQRSAPAQAPDWPRWLLGYRLAMGLHGGVWAAVVWLPGAWQGLGPQATLLFMLQGLCVGAMALSLFDLRAALMFVLPVVVSLCLRLALQSDPFAVHAAVGVVMAGLLIGMLAMAALRRRRERHALAVILRAERESNLDALEAQAALLEQQRMLELVQAHTGQGFWHIDNELRTTDANPAMCRMLGLSREQMLGRSIYEFVDAANAEVFRQHVLLRADGQAEGYEVALLRSDGSTVFCFNNATPLLDGQGRKVGALGLFSDISAQKLAEQQARQAVEQLAQKSRLLEATFDSLDQGILSVDANGRCNAWNRRFIALVQIPESLMQQHPLLADVRRFQLAQGHFGPQLERMDEAGRHSVQRFMGGETHALAERYQRHRADGRVVEVMSHFAGDGSVVRTYTDVTERHTAEAALIAARDEAERANRAKSDFLSRMSHELRTPMNAILGFGQLLEADAADPLSPGQHQRVQALLAGGRHLLVLIDEVLDIARIEAGTLRLALQPVDVAALAHDCIELVQPVALARGVWLQGLPPAEAGLCMRADATRLRQVLLNLLSNAIKFNRAGGAVRLSCHADGDQVVLEVADEGQGITEAQMPRLFQAFERLEVDGAIEGTGIGLALSRSLVALMHGEIGVRSVVGQGSVFWVRLPRDGALNAEDAAGTTTPRHRVLYIEDNEVNQVLMAGMLAHRPAIALCLANDGETGLALAAASPPDLVLLDIQLPGIDGFAVLRGLRQVPALQATPVIAVSANAMPTDLDDAQRAGFAAYLTKPLDLQRLLALVDAALALPAGASIHPPPGQAAPDAQAGW